MKKRVLAILLCAALALTLLPAAALPAAAANDTGSCGKNLIWAVDVKLGTLKITGTGEMDDYEVYFDSDLNVYSSTAPWSAFRTKIKTVSLATGVTGIGSCAFYGCDALQSATVPGSVGDIGAAAFSGCGALTAVTIPQGVTEIKDSTFSGCGSLTSVRIPDGVTYIGQEAFSGCGSLTSVDVPDSVTYIGPWAFSRCAALDTVTLPANLLGIGGYAFSESGIDNNAENREEGLLYIGNYLIDAAYGLTGAREIREGTTLIAERAFEGCDGLTSVVIPDSVTVIGDLAFSACTGLTSASVGGAEVVGVGAFLECEKLTDLTLSAGVERINGMAFCGCRALTSVDLPDTVTFIGAEAFENCAALTGITIPVGVIAINYWTFYGCTALTSVTIPAGVTAIGNSAFENCAALTEITLPDGLKTVGTKAFKHCDSLTSLTLPDSVTDTGSFAFAECAALTSVTLSKGLTAVSEGMFAGCAALTVLEIPDSVTEIGGDAFNSCTALPAAVLPAGVTKLGRSAFYNCGSMAYIFIPAAVTEIGDWAFSECRGLKDVYYTGPETEWNEITVGKYNHYLTRAALRCNASPLGYTDLFTDRWYYGAADFVIGTGLMGSTKTGALTFEPDTKVSRAMVASILYRMAGSPYTEYKGAFRDVPAGKWFTAAVEWCAQNGLAAGRGDGKFDPNGNVTRQELAVFMKKTASYLGRDTSGRDTLENFADAARVPAWAKEYVQWAVSAGLISGKASNGRTCLAPADNATRAEFASVITRFVQNLAAE